MLQRTPALLLEPSPATRPDRDAVAIGELYRKGNASLIDSARYYLQCGQLLTAKKQELKEQLGHGSWLPWLEANADVLGFESRFTAAKLMKAYAKCAASGTFDIDDLTPEQAAEISHQLWGHNDITAAWVNSGNAEWYTQAKYIELARTVLGGVIDVDPASCAIANRTVKAKTFFNKQQNGLEQNWLGTVWINSPWSLIGKYTTELITQYRSGRVSAAVMLTPANTSTEWFQEAGTAAAAFCLSNGRKIKFISSDGKLANPAGGSCFFYYGRDTEKFARVFGDVGMIVRPAAISVAA